MDKRNWTYKLTVLESYLDQSYDWAESADRYLATDLAHTGIHSGFTATKDPAGPNLNVKISGPGYAHDKVGRRLYESNPSVLVDCEYDEYGIATAVTPASGKERWISIFVRFTTQYTDPIVDGNGVTVYTKEYEDTEFFVRQAAETAAPSTTQVALQTEAILICDIKLTDGMTQIQNADIDSDRREDWIRLINPTTLTNLATQSFGTSLAAVDQIVQWIDDLQVGTAIGFTGAATWHDTNTIAATTVSTAIEEIVTVLAEDTTNPGSDKMGSDTYVAGGTFTLTRGSVWDQLKEIADAIDVSVQSNADENITGQWDFTDFITIDCSAVAAANATPITCTAKGTGDGGVFTGGATGDGVRGTGGLTSGAGVRGVATTNDHGIEGVGNGTGHGGYFTAGATGNGVRGVGGATSGAGGYFAATLNDSGVEGVGHGTGHGVEGTGGNTSGVGVLGVATTNDHGIEGVGNGTGHGGYFTAGATGNGARGVGGATSGAGGYFAATLNDSGVEGVGNGSGNGGVFTAGSGGAPILLIPCNDPTSLVNGQIWVTAAGALKFRANGATLTVTAT